jgi:hypothetical protein
MGARHFVAALHTLDPSARPRHMKVQNAICFERGSPLYLQVSGVTPDTCKAEPLVGLGAEGGTAGRHYPRVYSLSSQASLHGKAGLVESLP